MLSVVAAVRSPDSLGRLERPGNGTVGAFAGDGAAHRAHRAGRCRYEIAIHACAARARDIVDDEGAAEIRRARGQLEVGGGAPGIAVLAIGDGGEVTGLVAKVPADGD